MISSAFNVLIIIWLSMKQAHRIEGNIDDILVANQYQLLAPQENICFPFFSEPQLAVFSSALYR